MILLLMMLGALLVYLLVFMAMIVGLAAFLASGLVYFLTYMGSYIVAKIRHSHSPEWKFDKKPWTPDMQRFQEYAVVAGIASMVAMVLGFIAYGVSDGDWTITLGVASVAIPFGLLVMYGDSDPDNPKPVPPPVDSSRPWSSGPKS